MEDLKAPKLARPMDPAAMSNDLGILASLARELNNPALTGAVVPPEEQKEIARIVKPNYPVQTPAAPLEIPKLPGEGAPRPAFAPAPVVAQPRAAAAPCFAMPGGALARRVFFTGHSKVGKSWLAAQMGARVMELEDPIRAIAASSFGASVKEEDLPPFFQEVFSWGEGIVSKAFPLTGSRAMFIETVRSTKDSNLFGVPFEEFGTAGFWGRSLIARATQFHKEFPKEQVVVTGVYDGGQYQQLREAGFVPFHVSCNNITRTARGGTAVVNALSEGIERDLTKKISAQPNGPKLWAIWCDDKYSMPNKRLLTIEEFLNGVHA